MWCAVTTRNKNKPEKHEIVAIQSGRSCKEVFESLLVTLEEVGKIMGEGAPYMKNYETWGVGEVLFSVEPVSLVDSVDDLKKSICDSFVRVEG